MSAAADTTQQSLTERQRRFAELYSVSGNGADAARRAGYAKISARTEAARTLTNVNVVALVDELRKERLNALGVRPDRVLEELTASAFLDPKDVFNEDDELLPVRRMPHNVRRAIKKIRVREHYCKKTGEMTGRDVDIEFNDKLRANEILGRHLGILKEQPVQVNQQNVFAQIVAAAQGTSLLPVMTHADDDSANDIDDGAPVIDCEVTAKSDTPSQDMASDDTLAAFNTIDDSEENENIEAPAVAQTSNKVEDVEPFFRNRRRSKSKLNW